MRVHLFETRTGAHLNDMEGVEWKYDTGILAADKITLTIPAYTEFAKSVDMRDLLTVRKRSVALVDDGVAGVRGVPAAGSIESVKAGQDDDGRNVWEVTCYGPERVIDRGARVRLFPGWPLLDSARRPTTTYDVSVSGVEYGTIMKRLVSEAMKFPGGGLPIDFELDRVGTRVRSYSAINGKKVMEALDDLADLLGGVEYDFQPSILENDAIRFLLATGTDSARIVAGAGAVHLWNIGGRRPDTRGWVRNVNPGSVVTDAIFAGGKEDDEVLLARASSPELVDDGWPRAELWDNSHSSVTEESTLQAWADGALSGATETVSLEVRYEVARTLRHGEIVVIDSLGHWDMPNGETHWRVLSVGRGSDDPEWLKVNLVR